MSDELCRALAGEETEPVSDKPIATARTFRRYVRKDVRMVSDDLPLDVVQDMIRRSLWRKQHSVIETTWKDDRGWVDFSAGLDARRVSVRYVTGGQRHGLAASLDWPNPPNIVVFATRSS